MNQYQKLIEKADSFAQNGDVERAKSLYHQAIETEPKQAIAYYHLALIYHKQGDIDNAIHYFTNVSELSPNDATVFNNLGVLYYSKEMLDEAEIAFKKAADIFPNYAEAIYGLGKVYQKKANIWEAQEFEHFKTTVHNRIELLHEEGKLDEAWKISEKLVKLCSDVPEYQNDYAVLCYELGKIDEAINAIHKAKNLLSEDIDIQENYEMIHRSNENNIKKKTITHQTNRSLTTYNKTLENFKYIYPFEQHPVQEHTKRARIFTDPRCNVNCRFCYYVTKHSEEWSTELIKRQIDFAAQAGMRDIDFSGGESSMRRDFIVLIEYAKRYGFRSICTLTNGIKFSDEEFMKRCVNAGLTEILFSIHGYDEQNHDWLTHAKGSYKKIHKAIELAKKYGIAIRTNTTVTSSNFKKLEEHAEIIKTKIRPFQSNFILFNEWAEAVKIAGNFAVKYSEACKHVKKAIDVLKDEVPYINVRYVPFCFMQGYEKHVCDYPQKIYDPFEWSQRMLALCQKPFIYEPMRFYQLLVNELNNYSQNINLEPASISGHVADDVFVTQVRNDYVKRASCKDCKFYFICDGVEQSYSLYIGLDELEPIFGEKITNPLEFRGDFYKGYEKYLSTQKKEKNIKLPNLQIKGFTEKISKKISVVIPTYNRSKILKECLDSLSKQTMQSEDFEVIVTDDGSVDNTKDVIATFNNALDLKFLKQNHTGPSAARNKAIKESNGELIVIINDDTITKKDFLQKHYKLYKDFGQNDKIAFLGNRTFREKEKAKVMNYLYENIPLYTPLQKAKRGYYGASHFITFNLSMAKSAFLKYGFFDEVFPSAIAEDTELGIRWQLNGVKIYFEPSILAFHNHKMTVDGWNNQIIRRYTNSSIMYKKHPETKPKNYFMDTEKSKMKDFIIKYESYMTSFNDELKNIESEDIFNIEGKIFMGKKINNVIDFLNSIKQISPHYIMYKSFKHFLHNEKENQLLC